MKISLPENQSEITLEQYQRYTKLIQRTDLDAYNFNRRKLEIFTPLTFKETENVTQVDFEFCLNQIDKALNEEVGFTNRFKLGDVEFGFIPNLDQITSSEINTIKYSFGEWVDSLEQYKNVENLQHLMSVLFRPIINKDPFGNYEIIAYEKSEGYTELMKKMPLNIVNGALFFFVNLSTELQNFTLKYMKGEQKKAGMLPTTL